MQTWLAIALTAIMVAIYKSISPDTWTAITIVVGFAVFALACWFTLAYLVSWFLRIALKIKD